ncbi:MAG: efflux RND transporter periplasmic adaptor subunit, partial [Deferribacteraceae bacterium]|nr:efflux RND transporter periplasmic adaptor subunit [Deferribacteraceae bacterium]
EIKQSLEYVGTVAYESSSSVAAERAGRVDKVGVEEGQLVKKGDVLMSINADSLRYSIAAEKAKVAQQKATMDKYKRDFTRAETMYQEQTVSEQRYQDAGTDLEIQSQLYAVSLNQLRMLEEDLRKSSARAPFDGVVIGRSVTVGQWVNVGTEVYKVAGRRLEAIVNVPQSMINSVKVGLEVPVKINNKYYQGKVRVVVPQGNASLRTFPVKIDIPYDAAILGGMDCTVMIPGNMALLAMMVPRDAIITLNNNTVVYVIDNGKAKAVTVRVLGYSGTNAGIQATGLVSGAQVITRGNENVRDGQAVRTQ